ncbi:MAG: hypothetical protein DDT19_01689 [Syntrophomonadaceae bacterium]|nr:hypothetical protein [Bacillota bacterium]
MIKEYKVCYGVREGLQSKVGILLAATNADAKEMAQKYHIPYQTAGSWFGDTNLILLDTKTAWNLRWSRRF